MSDDDDTLRPSEPGYGWREMDEDCPGLDTEEERDQWANVLMNEDIDSEEWARTILVHDDHGNMMARVKYPDGREELFDLIIRRSSEVVKPITERESN